MPERLWRWVKKEPKLAAATLTTAALLVLVAVVLGVNGQEQARLRATADEAASRADTEAGNAKQGLVDLKIEQGRTREQLEHTRSSLVTAQLAVVAATYPRDPIAAHDLLHDYSICPIRLRDFAWGWYERQCDPVRAQLLGHVNGVLAVTYSPNGKVLASGGADRTIKLWDAATGQKLATLEGHTLSVRALAFSPDGKRLASGAGRNQQGEVKLWDVDSGQTRADCKGHVGPVGYVAFSRDGDTVASGSDDKTIKLWDVSSGQERATLRGHQGEITGLSFSPDGKSLASSSRVVKKPGEIKGEIRLWDPVSAQQSFALQGSDTEALSYSPDGKHLGVVADGKVSLIDLATLQRLPGVGPAQTVLPSDTPAVSLTFSRDGKQMAAGNWGLIRLWDLASGQQRVILRDKAMLGGTITMQGEKPKRFKQPNVPIRALAFSPDGKTLAYGSADGTVKLWDLVGQEPITLGHMYPIMSAAFRADGKVLVSSSSDAEQHRGEVKLWDWPSGQEVLRLQRTDSNGPADLSLDGKTLALGNPDRTIRLWDVDSRKERTVLRGHGIAIDRVAFSPDGRSLVSSGGGGTMAPPNEIKLWDLATAQSSSFAEPVGHGQSAGVQPR